MISINLHGGADYRSVVERWRFQNLQVVTSLADPSANIIFGTVVDERYNGEIHVTKIATGFTQSFQKTLLTDPRGTKLMEKSSSVSHESMKSPLALNSSATSTSAPRPTRKLFF